MTERATVPRQRWGRCADELEPEPEDYMYCEGSSWGSKKTPMPFCFEPIIVELLELIYLVKIYFSS